MVNCLLVSSAMMLCVAVKAELVTTDTASLSSGPSPNPITGTSLSSTTSTSPAPTPPTPTPTPSSVPTMPNANPGVPVKIDPKMQSENLVPTVVQLESGKSNYLRYCAECHGKDGEGKEGPKLVGSLMVTGPVYGHITMVLNGHPQSKMPSWGISEISDEVIASVVTYQRNAWGNGNKKEYGKHAGGVVTPSLIHDFRKTLKNLPVKQDVRT